MNVLIFGATGMVGQGVLRECLLAADVNRVVTVGRSATSIQHPKLHEIVRVDLRNYADLEAQLKGFDACFFCLGVSSLGMTQAGYEQITYDITIAAAETLAQCCFFLRLGKKPYPFREEVGWARREAQS